MSPRAFTRISAATLGFAVVALALSLGWPTRAADEKEQPKAKVEPVKRKTPWTTSKITGSPEPPPKYKSARVFANAKFNHPLLIAHAPGSDRFFIGEQEGTLYSLANKPDAKPEVFIDLRKEYKALVPNENAKGISEMYGLVFHPDFEKNRYCYVCYVLQKKDGVPGYLADGSRVSRFKVKDENPPTIDPKSEEVVITFQGGGHNGGDLHFGKDGYLYISTGDGRGPNPPDALNTGQDCSDLLSSILRIDLDKKDPGKNYAIPKDNPFPSLKDVRPEIWAFGFRNPWRMSFDRKTGDLWVGDVGWESWEMVYKIERGGNYGWSITEGRQPVKPDQKIGPTPIRPPTIELSHTIACSVTGGCVYRGKKFPELEGTYIFGDWETRRLWAARFDGEKLKEMPELVKPNIRVVAFGQDHAGELYYFDYDTGFMYTLEKNDGGAVNTKFPTKLSDTGLFRDVAKLDYAPGVTTFTPEVTQWMDGAHAEYALALPGDSAIALYAEGRTMPSQVFWHNFRMHFPNDAVLVKTIRVPRGHRDGAPHRRVETQILHFTDGDWRAYSYAWRDDLSDADLVPADGGEVVVPVEDRYRQGQFTDLVWTIPSRTQCIVCHNSWSEFALAFSVPQLNGTAGRSDGNQLHRLTRDGVIQRFTKDAKPLPPYPNPSAPNKPGFWVKEEPTFSYGDDPHKTLDLQARRYLHVNCSHCHRFGGGGGQVVLELDAFRPLKETGILDVKPKQGDFGLTDARLVAPGEPHRSVLYYRMAKFGRGRMPHFGSEIPDRLGLETIDAWICSLDKKFKAGFAKDAKGIDDGLKSVKDALPFARSLGLHRFELEDRDKVVAAAAKLPAGQVRELFEGYLPPDPKGRKLGFNPRPGSILALKGDEKKGEALFFNKDIKCASCHKVGDKGTALGPDLTKIGGTRTRPELLDSLLNPSARVEPQFAAYNVKTKDDRTFTGIIVKRDEKVLLMRDAENKEIRIAAENVEHFRPSRLSLMPDGQMAGLTPQEAADLLEYLVQRK